MREVETGPYLKIGTSMREFAMGLKVMAPSPLETFQLAWKFFLYSSCVMWSECAVADDVANLRKLHPNDAHEHALWLRQAHRNSRFIQNEISVEEMLGGCYAENTEGLAPPPLPMVNTANTRVVYLSGSTFFGKNRNKSSNSPFAQLRQNTQYSITDYVQSAATLKELTELLVKHVGIWTCDDIERSTRLPCDGHGEYIPTVYEIRYKIQQTLLLPASAGNTKYVGNAKNIMLNAGFDYDMDVRAGFPNGLFGMSEAKVLGYGVTPGSPIDPEGMQRARPMDASTDLIVVAWNMNDLMVGDDIARLHGQSEDTVS